jgi:hypothetical protein
LKIAVPEEGSAFATTVELTRIEKLEEPINVKLAFGIYRDRAFTGTGIVYDYVPIGQRPDGVSVSGR